MRKRASLTIKTAAELCFRCHRLAPFLFLNGNTFVAVARDAIIPALAHLSSQDQAIIRGTIGHFIAGTIGSNEMRAVLESAADSE
jgi:hypothetical protein